MAIIRVDAIVRHVAYMQEMVKLRIHCAGEISREMSMLETWTYTGGSYKNGSS
jgi:hypothetical protein